MRKNEGFNRYILVGLGEISEGLFMSSTSWNFVVTFFLYFSLKTIYNRTTLSLKSISDEINNHDTYQHYERGQAEEEEEEQAIVRERLPRQIYGSDHDNSNTSSSEQANNNQEEEEDDEENNNNEAQNNAAASDKVNKNEAETTAIITSHAPQQHINTINQTAIMSTPNTRATSNSVILYSIYAQAFAWTLPFLIAILSLFLFEYVDTTNQPNPFKIGVQVTTDTIKTIYYIVLEIGMLVFRILIYKLTTQIFRNNTAWSNTANEIRMKQEQRKIAVQLTLYSLPFFVCVTLLIVFRCAYDVDLFVRIANGTFSLRFHNWQKLILAFIRLVYPLKGVLDALCYCFISTWFVKILKKVICCQYFKKRRVLMEHDHDDEYAQQAEPMIRQG